LQHERLIVARRDIRIRENDIRELSEVDAVPDDR